MPTILEQALAELKTMPAEAQEAIAQDLLDLIRSERKGDDLFADPRSEALFERMADQVRSDIAAGDVLPGDPADPHSRSVS
jgi:hypothetical protein